ncbi:MAG TPA: hypothetical protein VHL59_01150 [Thermoanaerobaculia bacterium]|nr:hypothetical protein [Thermoanaerobaculia bacterium]
MPVFLFALMFAASADAQVRWGVRVGVTDGEPMIGGDMLVNLGSGFVFNPNLELSTDIVSTNADFHYDINIGRTAAFWLGTGFALVIPEGQDLDLGVNFLAGLGVQSSGRIFYTQLKATAPTDHDSYTSLAVGMRF